MARYDLNQLLYAKFSANCDLRISPMLWTGPFHQFDPEGPPLTSICTYSHIGFPLMNSQLKPSPSLTYFLKKPESDLLLPLMNTVCTYGTTPAQDDARFHQLEAAVTIPSKGKCFTQFSKFQSHCSRVKI